MILYALTLLPLAESLRRDVPQAIQPWYADDSAADGKVSEVAAVTRLLMQRGPTRGYFLNTAKSVVVCKPTDQAEVEAALSRFNFTYCEGTRYLGGFVGSKSSREKWLAPKIQRWIRGVTRLSTIAKRYPQTAYAGLTKSLQSEWMYLQRVVPCTAGDFQGIEDALRESFLPALFGDPDTDQLRGLSQLPVKQSGLGIPDPVAQASECFDTSVVSSSELVESLRNNTPFDVNGSRTRGRLRRRERQKKALQETATRLTSQLEPLPPATVRLISRAALTGSWLTVMPDRLNGTELAAGGFRDSV
jgi:hypothetical protein